MNFRKKLLVYAALPLATIGLIGASHVSAHGWFTSNQTPEEVATQQTAMFEQEANLLGITVDEFKEYWAQGKDVREIAEEKGISEETLRTKMEEQRKTEMKEQLNTLVSQNIITQAQADSRLTAMEAKIAEGGARKGGRGGAGFGGPF